MLPNDEGELINERWAKVHEAIAVQFPKYAGAVALEVAITISGPEELAALKALAEVRGFYCYWC